MVVRFTFCLLLVCGGHTLQAQTLGEQVTVYLETFLEKNKAFVSLTDLVNTTWHTNDPMGARVLILSDGKFKLKSRGFQAKTNKESGKWYVNNEFVVLKKGKQKEPIYVLKNDNQLVLVDDDQIDVLKQLLTEASYKDGELKPYSYEEIFTFLNGFTKKE